MEDAERHALVQQLGQAMSDISEDCYCAGWLGGTEYFVPELCRRAVESGRMQYWGHGEVTPEQARELVALAERAGCWADTDYYSVGYDPFQPFPMPPEYAEAIERAQSSEYAQRRQKQAESGAAADRAGTSG
jgi:hypothetical protein